MERIKSIMLDCQIYNWYKRNKNTKNQPQASSITVFRCNEKEVVICLTDAAGAHLEVILNNTIANEVALRMSEVV